MVNKQIGNVKIEDYSKHYVHVTAPVAYEAFSVGLDYVAEAYPGVSFSVDRSLTGMHGGAIITGHCCTFRAVELTTAEVDRVMDAE